jgi:TRAP-type transport system periplasmic protein
LLARYELSQSSGHTLAGRCRPRDALPSIIDRRKGETGDFALSGRFGDDRLSKLTARKMLEQGGTAMGLTKLTIQARTTSGAGACILLLALMLGAAQAADDKTYVMKLGIATVNDAQHEWCKRFTAMVEKDSGGRIKGEIYPASQLGPIPREIEGVQFGAIQGYVGPPEFLVGVDDRYEVLSAPGLVTDMAHGIRVTGDPELKKVMFGLGADKGIHGVALFASQPSSIVARDPVRHLSDIKGKKLRVLAADMQQEMLKRLGASPIAMTLGDVLPAIQQGAIDGAVLALTVDATMHYYDAAKYITQTNQPFIFSMAFLSKKWFDTLPEDLQKILDTDADRAAAEVNPWEADFFVKMSKDWSEHGEIINLPANEQAELVSTVETVGQDVVKRKPDLAQPYAVFAAAAKRTK